MKSFINIYTAKWVGLKWSRLQTIVSMLAGVAVAMIAQSQFKVLQYQNNIYWDITTNGIPQAH